MAEWPGVTPRPHGMKLTYIDPHPLETFLLGRTLQVPADARGGGGGTGLVSDYFQKP